MKSALFVLAFSSAVLLGACNQQDEATKFCLSAEGTHQDCEIACTIIKSDEACKKWEKLTIELCDKVGKQPCEEICEADKNEYACTKVKSM
jgi:uncharacterized lipoprotein YehR (DUF1307 family)